MICRVCGRGNCTESFHSFAEQEEMERRLAEKPDELDEETADRLSATSGKDT